MKKLLVVFTVLIASLLAPSFVGAKKQTPIKSLGQKKMTVKCFKTSPIGGDKIIKFKSYLYLEGKLMTGPSRSDRVFRVKKLGYKILSRPLRLSGKKSNLSIGNKWNIKKFHVSDDNLEYQGNWKYSAVNFKIPRGAKARVKFTFDLPKVADFLSCTKQFKV